MNPIEPKVEASLVVAVKPADRWQVYYRLQELDIHCGCSINQPLWVDVQSVTGAVQVWSVVRQLTASRRDLARHLERSWQSL